MTKAITGTVMIVLAGAVYLYATSGKDHEDDTAGTDTGEESRVRTSGLPEERRGSPSPVSPSLAPPTAPDRADQGQPEPEIPEEPALAGDEAEAGDDDPPPEKKNASTMTPKGESRLKTEDFFADHVAVFNDVSAMFLERNQVAQPEDYRRFSTMQDLRTMSRYFAGEYTGQLKRQKDKPEWQVKLRMDGSVEDGHYKGEFLIEYFNENGKSLGKAETRGPLEGHVRVVDEGERHSFLIIPNRETASSMFQIFISKNKKAPLIGVFFQKKDRKQPQAKPDKGEPPRKDDYRRVGLFFLEKVG